MPKLRQKITGRSGVLVDAPTWHTPKIKKAVLTASGPNPDKTKIETEPIVDYRIVFPFGPSNVQFQQYSGRYKQIDRPFDKPLNIFAGGSLRVVTFEAVIVNRRNGGLTPGPLDDEGRTVQEVLDTLETISQTGAACDFKYGASKLPFKSFLTEFSYTVTRRNPAGKPLQATASFQLTEKVSYNPDTKELPLISRPPVNIAPAVGGGGTTVEDELSNQFDVRYGQSSAQWKTRVVSEAVDLVSSGLSQNYDPIETAQRRIISTMVPIQGNI